MEVPRLRRLSGRYFWRPTPAIKALGFRAEPLGGDFVKAAERARHLNSEVRKARAGLDDRFKPAFRRREELKEALSRCLWLARRRAAFSDIPFDLDIDFLVELAEAQQWRCALSGIKFSVRQQAGRSVSPEPYRPSIDRIGTIDGYVRANCRLVCVAVNLAVNGWGDDVFMNIVESTAINRLGMKKPESPGGD